MMSLGVRANMEIAVASGFRFSLFGQPKEEELNAVRAYLRSLQPERSPYRSANGELSARAQQGQKIFEDPTTGCAICHPPPLFTDRRLHDVATHISPEPAAGFDTPTLIEIWRTAPYLHHGSAANLPEVFTRFNSAQQHGSTSQLSADELDALVEYVLSL
jgi:cytochrome c peroxidase